MKSLLNALSVVRPRHLLKAVLHPLQEIEAFKYHYRRVPELEFVSFLAGISPDDKNLASIYEELRAHKDFYEHLKKGLAEHPDGYGGQMTRESSALYALVRLFKPEVMIETGVADGYTSSFILRAMEDNGRGKLYSIDVPHTLLPPGKGSGWLVEERLRHRWSLRLGPSSELLEPLLKEVGQIDFFLHDSLHSYENMMFEYRAAWPQVRPGGLFLSHDVGSTEAFFDFYKEAGKRWRDWRVYHVLGGFRKN